MLSFAVFELTQLCTLPYILLVRLFIIVHNLTPHKVRLAFLNPCYNCLSQYLEMKDDTESSVRTDDVMIIS